MSRTPSRGENAAAPDWFAVDMPPPRPWAVECARTPIQKSEREQNDAAHSGLHPPPFLLPIGVAQPSLEDLAAVLARQVAGDLDRLRHLVISEVAAQIGAYYVGRQGGGAGRLHDG